MARERGFVLEVTAFLPSETDIHSMSVAAHKLEQVTEALHGLGFSAVAVSSKFTSRKVEERAQTGSRASLGVAVDRDGRIISPQAAPDPMPGLDDSKFATNSGTPMSPQERLERHAADILNNAFGLADVKAPGALTDPLDIPAALDRRAKG